MELTIGKVSVVINRQGMITILPNGRLVFAHLEEQAGQAIRARELGYDSAEEMNREHDIVHSLLAYWLGLEASPTLKHVAEGKTYPHWRLEEAAVLAIQAYARAALKIDLVELAKDV